MNRGSCGQITVDGTPCKNPPGCRIDHRSGATITAGSRMAAISAAAAASNDAFSEYAHSAAAQVIDPLSSKAFTHAAPGQNVISVEALVDALKGTSNEDGFTLSPRTGPDGRRAFASKGICVALPGSDFHLSPTLFDAEDDHPSDGPFDEIRMFFEHLKPLADTGHVWIGVWKDPQGRTEINATVVFREEDQRHATRLAHQWNQQGVFHISQGEVILTGGTGGESIYDNKPGRLRNWRRRKGTTESAA